MTVRQNRQNAAPDARPHGTEKPRGPHRSGQSPGKPKADNLEVIREVKRLQRLQQLRMTAHDSVI